VINCHELIEFCLDYLEGELPQKKRLASVDTWRSALTA
jgi:hypothetical protein